MSSIIRANIVPGGFGLNAGVTEGFATVAGNWLAFSDTGWMLLIVITDPPSFLSPVTSLRAKSSAVAYKKSQFVDKLVPNILTVWPYLI